PPGRPPEPRAGRPVIEGATREAPAHASPGPDQPRPPPRRVRPACPLRARQPRAPAVTVAPPGAWHGPARRRRAARVEAPGPQPLHPVTRGPGRRAMARGPLAERGRRGRIP